MSKRTNEENCTFLVKLPRTLRGQLKTKAAELEGLTGHQVFPNELIVLFIKDGLTRTDAQLQEVLNERNADGRNANNSGQRVEDNGTISEETGTSPTGIVRRRQPAA